MLKKKNKNINFNFLFTHSKKIKIYPEIVVYETFRNFYVVGRLNIYTFNKTKIIQKRIFFNQSIGSFSRQKSKNRRARRAFAGIRFCAELFAQKLKQLHINKIKICFYDNFTERSKTFYRKLKQLHRNLHVLQINFIRRIAHNGCRKVKQRRN